ncbi:MAG: response regulator [Vicinamibacterales bacterium]
MLRLVHLEDDPADVALVQETLLHEGLDCEIIHVSTRASFVEALDANPDLVLADSSLPGFDGLAALRLVQARRPGVPFVYVSGTLGEEAAIQRLREGATDYVLKHSLGLLPSAVRRALQVAGERRLREAAEHQLRELNAELEDRVRARTRELEEANAALSRRDEELQAASRAKNDFLSRMSHDLRTPLNAIIGFGQLLQLDQLPAEQADNVGQILKGARHLLELINEVLDITRIETGYLSLSLEPVDLAEVVQECVELIKPLATARDIRVDLPAAFAPTFIRADQQRIRQVLLNLLSNAVKYNHHGGAVRVACDRRDQRVVLSVTDTGAGISAEKLQMLFTPFERLGAEQTAVEGTGLGLVLSRRLTEAMGGHIGIESAPGHGSTFWVDLPASEPPEEKGRGVPVRPGRAASGAATTGVILYIEDNLSNARLLQRLLTHRPGVTLRHATSGEAGLASVRTSAPDLVLLDLHLPDMHGEEVLRRVHADPATRELPVAVLSADATASQSRRMLASGAAAYITKPFNIPEVLALIDEILGTSPQAPQ